MTTKLLIACALEKELTALKARLKGDYQFLVTGLGAQKTYHTLKKYLSGARPSLLLFTGTAGQLNPSLRLGQVVFPAEWCFQHGPCFSADIRLANTLKKQGWVIEGRGLTVRFPVLKKKSRVLLFRKFGALACDMESAAALQVATEYQLSCLAPKIISDTANFGMSKFWTEFENNMNRLAQYLEELLEFLLLHKP